MKRLKLSVEFAHPVYHRANPMKSLGFPEEAFETISENRLLPIIVRTRSHRRIRRNNGHSVASVVRVAASKNEIEHANR